MTHFERNLSGLSMPDEIRMTDPCKPVINAIKLKASYNEKSITL